VLKIPDDVPIENRQVTNAVQSAQEQVEAQNFEMRKNVLKYDDVMNRQRYAIYGDRRQVLEGADVSEQLRTAATKVVSDVVQANTEGFIEDWDLDTLWTELKTLYPVGLDKADYDGVELTQAELVQDFTDDVQRAYDAREEQLTPDVMRQLERQVLLTVLDRKWREHLYEMDYLREGIGLRAMAQRDPLVEYQREGATMFEGMMAAFLEEVVGYLFNLEVSIEPTPQPQPVGVHVDGGGAPATARSLLGQDAEPTPRHALNYSGPDESGQASVANESGEPAEADAELFANVGRNKPCPCGSGKKFKNCHGRA
jgi:preprotein translocase subunit SecA